MKLTCSQRTFNKKEGEFIICLFQPRKLGCVFHPKGFLESSHREKPAGQVHEIMQARAYA